MFSYLGYKTFLRKQDLRLYTCNFVYRLASDTVLRYLENRCWIELKGRSAELTFKENGVANERGETAVLPEKA